MHGTNYIAILAIPVIQTDVRLTWVGSAAIIDPTTRPPKTLASGSANPIVKRPFLRPASVKVKVPDSIAIGKWPWWSRKGKHKQGKTKRSPYFLNSLCTNVNSVFLSLYAWFKISVSVSHNGLGFDVTVSERNSCSEMGSVLAAVNFYKIRTT